MAKRLVHDYTFTRDSSDGTKGSLVLHEIVPQDRLLLITNVTDGENIFTFNDPTNKINTINFDYDLNTTTIQLAKNTSTMTDYLDDSAAFDKLQVFIEDQFQTVEFAETYIDPVAKIRVSNPENLIDTDFEYGLQSSKWETLELVKNIPTFFSRSGDLALAVTGMDVRPGSDTVTVTCNEDHNVARGTPILIQGTKNILADGGFVVTARQSSKIFEYKAKSTFSDTTSILDTYTQVFVGSLYQSTEFSLEGIAGVTSDEAPNASALTVQTKYPTLFTEGTSFFMSNSFAKSKAVFQGDSSGIDHRGFSIKTGSVDNDVATGETSGFAIGATYPYAYQPANISECGLLTPVYFDATAITVDTTNNRLDFTVDHELADGCVVRYFIGEGNTAIGGLSEINYYVNVVNSTTIELKTSNRNDTADRVNLTSAGTNGGISKSCLASGLVTYAGRNDGYLYHDYATRGHFSYNNSIAIQHLSPVTRWGVYSTDPNFTPYWDYGFNGGENPNPADLPEGGQGGANNHLYYPYGSTSRTNNTFYGAYNIRLSRTSDGGTNAGRVRYTYYGQYNNIGGTGLATTKRLLVAFEESPIGNSIYFADHGLNTGDTAVLSVSGGSLPTGLTAGSNVEITKVDDNRIKFSSSGTAINIRDTGSAAAVFGFTARSMNLNNDTIVITGNTLNNGDTVTYSNNGASNIPGLVDGTDYFVFEKTTDRIKLATSITGFDPALDISIDTNATSGTNNRIYNFSGNSFIFSPTNAFSGLADGDIVKAIQTSGAITHGMTSGAFYFVDQVGPAYIRLFPTDSDRVADTNRITLNTTTQAGSVRLRKSTLVDFTGYDSGVHSLLANFVGAADGVFSLDSNLGDSGTRFTIKSNQQVLRRDLQLTNLNAVDPNFNALKINNHGFITGNKVLYQKTGSVIGGLTDSSELFVKRVNNDWFRLATTELNAQDSINGSFISLDSVGDGTSKFTGTSIVGETEGVGIIVPVSGSNVIEGEQTLFTSNFNKGDEFKIYFPEEISNFSGTANASTNRVNVTATAGYATGAAVVLTDVASTDYVAEQRYYARIVSGTEVTLHPTPANATANSNIVNNTTSATVVGYLQKSIGKTFESTITYVNSNSRLTLADNLDSSADSANYAVNSQLLVRADGFALHRPYDGGVELIPSTNPDGRMIRQTRKYFRYQSGKGIQVSYAVNFKPSVDIESFTRSGTTGTIKTRYPHRINITDSADGIDVVVANATNGANFWNGTHRVISKVDDYSFNVALDGTPTDPFATGIATFNVNAWNNCSLRCGLYDDQNGLLFDYNGQDLGCVIRSSVQQLSGVVSVTFNAGDVIGTGTKFLSQINVNEDIVIKGQTYTVVKIASDTLCHILPSYRGNTQTDVIVTKIIDNRVPQAQWNIDKCDGTGITGFKLELNRIQMAYIDYSWYGAGKVRFGFKDQNGVVRYVHQFVHGNKNTEAYMRSGNVPARYELINIGKPTYVPALAHWGTSVIMDGTFDDDKAYVFTANSLNNSVTVGTSITASGRIEDAGDDWQAQVGSYNYYRDLTGPGQGAITLATGTTELATVSGGMTITGPNIPAGTTLTNPFSQFIYPTQPYQPSISSRHSYSKTTLSTRTLLLIDNAPTGTSLFDSDYTITLSDTGGGTNVSRDFPLISVRLAPSVDTNTPGFLGEREIINRMQLILNETDVLTSHGIVVELRLNGRLDNNDWQRVSNPSLSQLIFHNVTDTVQGGTIVFSFNAEGSPSATRVPVLTSRLLGEVATLGNSILGGDNTFPDGPDVLTVVARLREDVSTVTASNPLQLQGRISWSESQA